MPKPNAIDDAICLDLGREIVRMIHELQDVSSGEAGYIDRKITFPGGAVHLFIANDELVARIFNDAARKQYDLQTVTPRSELN